MKIAFMTMGNKVYDLDTPYHQPLGGSQSAICYLAENLALLNNQVFLLNNIPEPKITRGVACLPLSQTNSKLFQELDVLIIQNLAGQGKKLKSLIGEHTLLILWSQHAEDQEAIQALADQQEANIYDGIVLISDWQKNQYLPKFPLDTEKIKILRNAISPKFANLFEPNQTILQQKSQTPTLAYTSTPFRGLDILVELFPKIRQAIPGAILKIFSSMKVYQTDENQEKSQYSWLYEKCQQTEGIEYLGSVSQTELAQQLKSIQVLAYPNTFPETSCIAVMEAMASGCYVVTSHLGALPETCAGFANLIPLPSHHQDYQEHFAQQTIFVLKSFLSSKQNSLESYLQEQVSFTNNQYSWSIRAQEWLEYLLSLKAYQYYQNQAYQQAINYYQYAITITPNYLPNYWYLGLSQLFSHHKIEAESTWMSVLIDNNPENLREKQESLLQILKAENSKYLTQGEKTKADLISAYIEELETGAS
jgi:glycosyltransferase involved in cell wall biosynthesis